jgi:LCP family protein required for cell wall assembly
VRRSSKSSRALLSAALSTIVPGLGVALVQKRRGWWALTGLSVAVALVATSWVMTRTRSELLRTAFDTKLLLVSGVALLILGALHAWSVLDAVAGFSWKRKWPSRLAAGALSASVILVYALGAGATFSQRQTIENVFQAPRSIQPVAAGPDSAAYEAAVSPSTTKPLLGRMTFLLLGGDAGEGRWSRRTDTMIAVSADLDSGAIAVVSVPRNLVGLPFPEGKLREAYPYGFPGLANAVYVGVSARPDLVGNAPEPGIEALRIGISELLGWQIDRYLLVDLAGFVNVVDALGGLDITVTSNVQPTGKLPGSQRQVGGFKKGERVHMDGEQALAYARSRTGTSDYARMRRQRCVVSQLFQNVDPISVLTHFGELQKIAQNNVITDVSASEIPHLLDVVSLLQRSHPTSVVLAPPVIQPSSWDAAYVRALASQAWEKAVLKASGTVTVSPTTLVQTSTPPRTTTPAAIEDMSEACSS